MPTDFQNAHERHWDDAERLFQAQRWANADHLYGLAAECGLKRLMQAFGMQLDPVQGRPICDRDAKHADAVWRRFETYRGRHAQGIGYALPTQNPFANWNASQRYSPQGDFTEAITQEHQDGARIVWALVRRAVCEGLI